LGVVGTRKSVDDRVFYVSGTRNAVDDRVFYVSATRNAVDDRVFYVSASIPRRRTTIDGTYKNARFSRRDDRRDVIHELEMRSTTAFSIFRELEMRLTTAFSMFRQLEMRSTTAFSMSRETRNSVDGLVFQVAGTSKPV
jgi:hypothetical protein